MPHLSPMSWLAALMTFWTILFTLMTATWWTQLMAFPKSIKKSHKLTTSWLWSV